MYELIQRVQLTSSQQTIELTNIPSTYTDLMMLVSARVDGSAFSAFNDDTKIIINGGFSSSNFSYRNLFGEGSGSGISDTWDGRNFTNNSQSTANTFSNMSVYVPNYAGSTQKSFTVDSIVETNGTPGRQLIAAGVWNQTSAITSIGVRGSYGLFVPGSSVTLYGINRTRAIGRSPQAMGGYINYANGYWYHTFTGSGSFVPFNNMQVEYLIIGGGGGAARFRGGGGGAGGYRCSVVGEYSGGNLPAEPMMSLTANVNYPVIVGAGGAGNPNSAQGVGGNGTDSSFNSVIGTGGGGGGGSGDANTALSGVAGGSGGGGGASDNAGSSGGGLAIGVATQGFVGAGGTSGGGSLDGRGGGGGGAGSAGSVGLTTGGNGGQGIISSITGTAVARAGGGGGGTDGRSVPSRLGGVAVAGGGQGNGSGQTNTAGTPNTGGGGGGGGPTAGTYGNDGAPGGSGVVIIRYKG